MSHHKFYQRWAHKFRQEFFSTPKECWHHPRECVEKLAAYRPIFLAFLLALVATALVGLCSLPFYLSNFFTFLENVAVEAHGMVFDLFVIGFFVFWLNSLGDKRRRIRNYQEQIDDFRGWDEKEAVYRIAGIVRRLNREGVTNINLDNAFLANANLIETNLSGANLRRANLREASLQRAYLKGAHLEGADLCQAHPEWANMEGAYLREANLEGANLEGANLREATLHEANLRQANLIGAYLSGADLTEADLHGALLQAADLTGADLRGADLSGIRYDELTEWPEGFTPPASG